MCGTYAGFWGQVVTKMEVTIYRGRQRLDIQSQEQDNDRWGQGLGKKEGE